MTQIINIGVVEDHLLVRQGLIALLKEFEGINILFDVSNGRELLNTLKNFKPDILLLDIEMPVMNGRDVFGIIRSKYPKIKIVILSTHYKDAYILEFIKMGANGFLNKNSGIEKIVDVIYSVHESGTYFDNGVSMVMAKSLAKNTQSEKIDLTDQIDLTGREIEIIRLICSNKSNKEIADILHINIRTVEGHRLKVMRKTKCRSILDLTTFALQNNLIAVV